MATIGQTASHRPRPPRGRMSVEQYEKLIAAGVIDERASVELIEGRIVGKTTKGDAHCTAADLVQEVLVAALAGSGWLVRIEKPVAIPGRRSMPEPDFAIVRGRPRDYRHAQPRPENVGLILEIADSSLQRDRRRARSCLAGGIPECWILNLVEDSLEVYRPGVDRRVLNAADAVDLVLEGRTVARIAVADMLPEEPRGG